VRKFYTPRRTPLFRLVRTVKRVFADISGRTVLFCFVSSKELLLRFQVSKKLQDGLFWMKTKSREGQFFKRTVWFATREVVKSICLQSFAVGVVMYHVGIRENAEQEYLKFSNNYCTHCSCLSLMMASETSVETPKTLYAAHSQKPNSPTAEVQIASKHAVFQT
jgi:hypothetical protein